jgi:hypothetical protein
MTKSIAKRRMLMLIALAAAAGLAALTMWTMERPRTTAKVVEARAASPPPPNDEIHGAATVAAAHGGCDHPFIPSSVGSRLRYKVQHSGHGPVIEREIEYRIERAQAVENEWQTDWRVTVMPSSSGAKDERSFAFTRSCERGGAAEDPWSGEMAFPIEKTIGNIWRWPRALNSGLRFGGHVEFVPMYAGRTGVPKLVTMDQQHTVEVEEAITVPAGEFKAWRVRFRGVKDLGTHKASVSGLLWVARDVGLIESIITVDDNTNKSTLLSYGS